MKALLALLSLLLASDAQAQSANEFSEQCAKQAAEVFQKEWGKGPIKGEEYELRGRYEHHYSSQFNKCFYLETRTFYSKRPAESMSLWDLNDNNHYGSYSGNFTSPTDPPTECWVQEKRCTSEQEWRNLISPYMED
jgi:type II secretory pathway pseudopilin PulG